ncbi:MAG TPA: hypothetical protein VFN67_26010 [Polyangiales bacterium]|nr:hypothetical protein [Polyangiales bacterium]
MDIEDSSVPYRAFLRSGTYPAITERFVRSGGVLVRAAGWAALVVGAASAGYTTTQRLVSPSAADPNEVTRMAAAQIQMPVPRAASAAEPVHGLVEPTSAEAERGPQCSNTFTQATPPASVVPTPSSRKRAGAVVPRDAHASADSELAASPAEVSRAEQIAERVRALDNAPAAVAPHSAVSASRDDSEPKAPATPAKVLEAAPPRRADVYASVAPLAAGAPSVVRAAEPTEAPSSPLSAAARIAGLVVRGPLSAAHVRRSVERVQPMLSGCYSEAARQAGRNRFAPVRVQLTIDEAGRVKLLPKVEGVQLPGLSECLSSALSKLVCQAPDTGTAHASIILGFVPEH